MRLDPLLISLGHPGYFTSIRNNLLFSPQFKVVLLNGKTGVDVVWIVEREVSKHEKDIAPIHYQLGVQA